MRARPIRDAGGGLACGGSDRGTCNADDACECNAGFDNEQYALYCCPMDGSDPNCTE